jgi:hypothetical protein
MEKEIKDYSLELVFGTEDNEKLVKVNLKRPSMAVRDAILRVKEEMLEDQVKNDNKYSDLVKFLDESKVLFPDVSNINKRFEIYSESLPVKNQLEILVLTSQKKDDLSRIANKYIIKFSKVIIDPKQLLTEEKSLFNSDFNSDFWSNQDLIKLEEAVEFFRERNRI